MIYMTLFVIGAIFYLATLLVHALVPDMRRSIKGLSLMAHCACMLAAHIAQVVAETEVFTSISESEVVSYFCQYTILGGFFWLNVMCLDIGNTFRSLKSMVQCVNLDYSSELRKFQKYCVYAFGVPLILMLVTFGVDQSDLDYNNPFNPNIGLTACWLDNDSSAIIVFFYGPVGLLVLTNTVLFIYVSCKISSGDPVLKNISSFTKRRHRKSVILYSKLSALMGLHWIIGIILEAVGDENYWYFNNFINAVRSIFIFRMAVYKTKVRSASLKSEL
ncbi:hypothetical protein B566_EDAN007318 [Ephemera danica]|nr:hypothetical protein B566_EDAN007318 [Ephemera danica]